MTATSLRTTGFWRLTWKEYRTARLFWLSVIVLAALIELLAAAFSQSEPTTLEIIYSFALGTPAFFAVGCAGAAFAVEREEGTFEFLRAAPVSSGQVLASKLTLVTLATAAMFAVLWPLALLISGNRLPSEDQLPGMLGLWLVAAFEAIAWGTLFSLLGARPLLAVVLAIVAASTCAHVLAWTATRYPSNTFVLAGYLAAVPRRSLLALIVLAADVYLGLRWLNGVAGRRQRRPVAAVPIPAFSQRESETSGRPLTEIQPLLAKRDRSAMLGHLLWQHWRQSRRLMLTMGILYVVLLPLGHVFQQFASSVHLMYEHQDPTILYIVPLATIMGIMVFLPDQEQRRYRYLAEHNVPPRLVWLTRQLPWLVTLAVSTGVLCTAWMFTSGHLSELLRYIGIITDPSGDYRQFDYAPHLYLPPVGVGIAVAAVAYSAGQFVSILVRSGITAGFLGLILSGALCGWVLLMHTMEVSFLCAVWPIPLVLLFATWRRAPDWIGENKRWSARSRVAAAGLIPALILLVVVPIFRVHQVPYASPGFDPAQFEAEIAANLQAGLATAEMYRKASDLLTDVHVGTSWFHLDRPSIQDEQDWLQENSAVLALLLKTSERPVCMFADPRTQTNWPNLRNGSSLIELVLVSARQLEREGKLDESLDRYFAALRVESRIGGVAAVSYDAFDFFRQLKYWGVQRGQTPERILGAVKRLQAINCGLLRLDERLKSDYIVARRSASGDPNAIAMINRTSVAADLVWLKLMPWEKQRAVRMLNLLTETALERLLQMRSNLSVTADENAPRRSGLFGFCRPSRSVLDHHGYAYFTWEDAYFQTWIEPVDWGAQMLTERGWLRTTVPSLRYVGDTGLEFADELAAFEVERRATMIVLALEAYRLEHGELPQALSEISGAFPDGVPDDPYSGIAFQYCRNGYFHRSRWNFEAELPAHFTLPVFRETNVTGQDVTAPTLIGVSSSGIWSSGTDLVPRTGGDYPVDLAGEKSGMLLGYALRSNGHPDLSPEAALEHGKWFAIPDKQDK